MIRRHVGDEFFLITQDNHARLSGRLGRCFGNDLFAKPEPFEAVMMAISMHDAGWPEHDRRPTLNEGGLPRDVFESVWEIALPVWTESAGRAEAEDAYAGLLVSLHVLGLSNYALTRTPIDASKGDQRQRVAQFELNKFQHREIERQEKLRRKLGLRTDVPLTLGVAKCGVDTKEDQLLGNIRMLQAMDQISLGVCCTSPPMNTTAEVYHEAGGKAERIGMKREGEDLVLAPWPFDRGKVECEAGHHRPVYRPVLIYACFHSKNTGEGARATINSRAQTPAPRSL